MGIKLINKFASAALVLSFCGAVSLSAFAQDRTDSFAALKNDNNKKTAITVFDKFDKVKEEKAPASAAPAAKKQAASDDVSWTGFYVGGYVGSNFSRTNTNTSTVYSPTGYFTQSSVNALNATGRNQLKETGFSGGAQGGYNYQSGRWLVGVEADFGSNRIDTTAFRSAQYPCCAPDTFSFSDGIKTNWMMTVRPRAGIVYDRALFYVTGGLALTDIEYAGVFNDTFADAIEGTFVEKTKAGWTGGGGMEYKVNRRWSLKGEYLFADFGRVNTTSANLATLSPSDTYPENPFSRSFRLKNHNLRFGVNFHF